MHEVKSLVLTFLIGLFSTFFELEREREKALLAMSVMLLSFNSE